MTDKPQAPGPNDVERRPADAAKAGSVSAASPAATGTAATSATKVDEAGVESLLDQAQAALAGIDESPAPLPAGMAPFEFKNLSGAAAANEQASLDLLRDVQLDLKIELGRTQMHLEDVLSLNEGTVVTLDKLAGDPVDIYANGRLIARGEVLVLNDNFCIRVAELIADEGDSLA
jgi:flagellar motor switch protein FliN/FliY